MQPPKRFTYKKVVIVNGEPSLKNDLKKLVKHAWWLGILLGLVCHLVPPNYQAACRAIINACKP